MERQTVAIDGRVLAGNRAGKGRYLAGVLEGWQKIAPSDRILIYGDQERTELPFEIPRSWQWIPARPSLPGAIALSYDARWRGAKVIFSAAAYSVPVFAPLPTVMTIHDLAIFRVPEAKPAFRSWLAERLFLGAAIRRARHIIAVSEFTKKELMDYLRVPSERITVAPNAASLDFHPQSARTQLDLSEIRSRYNLPKQFLLVVGTVEPRKNPKRILAAFTELSPVLQRKYPLIWAGKMGWSIGSDVRIKMQELSRAGVFRHLNYVVDTDLPRLYNLATALVYPSLYEGFGLPPLEAMASGCPVVTSCVSALPEVVGDAALLVDPNNTHEIAFAMRQIVSDPALRRTLIAAGIKQAKRFQWTETAKIIRKVLYV